MLYNKLLQNSVAYNNKYLSYHFLHVRNQNTCAFSSMSFIRLKLKCPPGQPSRASTRAEGSYSKLSDMVMAVLWNLFLSSPTWASPQGFPMTLRLASVSVSDLRKNKRVNAKREATSFYYLNSEVTSHHVCLILFARSKLLNSVHTRAWINRKQYHSACPSSMLPNHRC